MHPPAEVQVTVDMVEQLIDSACPELRAYPVRWLDEGWDNFIFEVGPYAARLPRRKLAVPLLLNEQRWLPVLAARLPLDVPLPMHAGQPGPLFPWPWSIVPWIAGQTAQSHIFTFDDTVLLAQTLQALHQPAGDDAPENPFRGVPLPAKQEIYQRRLKIYATKDPNSANKLNQIWQAACLAPPAESRCWLHGDLHPRNVIVRDGKLVGLIDWGDIHGGDVATDLACAWLLPTSAEQRREFFAEYGASDDVVHRARGWALHIGLGLLESDDPRHAPLGLATLERLMELP